ncbi:MAG: hypothetical protein ACPGSL_02615 [Vicingaceae bacterium]
MKRIKLLLPLSVFFILFCSAIKPTSTLEKISSLEVKGYIFNNDEKVNGALVKLYQKNKLINQTNSKKGKFSFTLLSGARYTIEVIKFGSVTEIIQVSTVEKTQFVGKYLYEFRIDLMNVSRFENVDMSLLDFPTAIIKYDKNEGEYLHDAQYSIQLKADLKALENKAK